LLGLPLYLSSGPRAHNVEGGNGIHMYVNGLTLQSRSLSRLQSRPAVFIVCYEDV
jgi:hypothetical protein